MKIFKLLSIIVFSLFTTLLLAEAKVVFTINAEYQEVKGSDWKKVAGGMTLQNYSVVRTQDRGRLIINTNGHMIRLAPNTQVELASVTSETKLNLTQGKLWAKVQTLQGGSRFVVSSPTSLVGVRGTEFILEHVDNITKLLVMEGAVAFGADLEALFKLIHAGGYAEFRNSKVDQRKLDNQGRKNLLRGFPDFIAMKSLRNRFYQRFYNNRRNYFKSQISRELIRFNRTRDYVRTKVGDDRMAQRVVTDKEGNVTQILQVLRKTADNKVVIYNITSQKDFINVLQYTGTFENPVPNSLDRLKAMTDNKELEKDMYIVQREDGQLDWVRIEEFKNLPTGDEQWLTVNNTASRFQTDFPKLKQAVGENYLKAEFRADGDPTGPISLTLKVYVLDNDGKIVSDPNIAAGLDFLMTGSVQFVFEEGTMTFNSLNNTVHFNVMPDVGFIVWLRD